MKVVIVEDETRASKRLVRLIKETNTSIEIKAILESVQSSLDWFKNNDFPDLIFMDINLSDGTAFDIFSELSIKTPIVFTTAYDHYALRAFNVNVIDYLLKPIKKEHIRKAISKFTRLKEVNSFSQHEDLLETIKKAIPGQPKQRLMLRIGNRLKLIYMDEIAYCYCNEKTVFLVTFDNHQYPIDKSLDKLEGEFDPFSFFRINRKYLVSLKAIKELYAFSKARVKVTLNPTTRHEVIVSVERSVKFKKWLEGIYN